MNVFVVNKNGRALMPTTPRKARLLIKSGKAKIFKRVPFTIQLIHGSSGYVQDVQAGIDTGYKNIGFSAISSKDELLGGEAKMLDGMSERLKERSMYRTQRRNRLRHRQPRFDNRKRDDSWLAPSIQHKLDTHFKVIEMLKTVLPISHLTIEIAEFDIQKIKNPVLRHSDW